MTLRIPPPSDEVVIRAWRRTGGPAPSAVEPLGSRRRKKSVLFRLVGVGEGGDSVVAKLCRGRNAGTERRIYEEVLPGLLIALPRFYGSLEEEEGIWLFLEDGGETRCDPLVAEHRLLAARWLAGLHSAGPRAPRPDLPDRGPAHYLRHLRSGRAAILGHLEQAAFDTETRALLESVVAHCDAAEARWGEIEAACAPLPRTLVHGDFCRKNLHVRERGGGLELFAMDWEMAGWGVPAADLWPTRRARLPLPDVAEYGAAIREHCPDFDPSLPRRLVGLGRVFRNLAGIEWASVDLPNVYQIPWLRIYRDELGAALRETGWAA